MDTRIEKRIYWFSIPGIVGLILAALSGDNLAQANYLTSLALLVGSFLCASFAYRDGIS